MSESDPRVAVIGGGVSGLVAALRLRQRLGSRAVIDVFEASSAPGGLLASQRVDGLLLDSGAESFIVRRPEAVALIDELGLTDHVVTPTTRRPAVLAGGRLHPLPRPTLMGIPADVSSVGELIVPTDRELMLGEASRPLDWSSEGDVSIGEFVADRFGRSVVDRSVDPMLSGVYSSRSDDIGLRAALPQLAARLDAGAGSLGAAVTSLLPPSSSAPVFGALDGGYRLLVDRLIERSGARVHLDHPVGTLAPDGRGWAVDEEFFDAVVVALPAPAAAGLLADGAPALAEPLRRIETASSALVLLAIAPGVELPDHSGVLVATGEATTAKAITLSSRKWSHLSAGPGLVRASFGRFGDPVDDTSDQALVDAAITDLGAVVELSGSEVALTPGDVIDAAVQRWPVGLPRYAPGHRTLVAELAAHRPTGLALCGSAYDGVGVPACIARAGVAVGQVVTDLAITGAGPDGTMEP
ncbi:FAD-dependent oxidoreductase [Williamsia phyllosphaerae]|uniref:Protoporphyrinogen oxidase n=1 Tax=Williamsia phyllosphaerae TaxID=885042 RepID=A0ABQ1V8W3_9NOCA|nr:FAD-dependent oxidoreductase [Williamsia phyllosphaerae]GGF41071.1 protoporphyrinogen oxidase [Williamsia phyllosphaerae]